MNKDTIAAIATASGTGGIGIVRISGPDALTIGQQISLSRLNPRVAQYTPFTDRRDLVIDHGIAIFFKAPASFTGEDIVELQAHGGPVVLDLLLKEALGLGARMARPGEFSERAFLNDKIDLVQAEAIADIIDCQSEAALRSSLRTFSGDFSKKINQLVEDITRLRMYVEAAIDFPEEEVDFVTDGYIDQQLKALLSTIELTLQQSKSGAVLTKGLNLTIIGRPNAGKSSLLNALAGDEIAIVTEQAGTTRDLVRQQITLDDIPINVVDTAGLRRSDDQIEQEGIKRVRAVTESADILCYLRDAAKEGESFCESTLQELIEEHGLALNSKTFLIVINNKIDLIGKSSTINTADKTPVISLSAKNKDGMDLIAGAIKNHYGLTANSENSFSARRRHINQIEIARNALEKGWRQLKLQQAGELLAEDLRSAQNALGEITGQVSSDDLLGEIFSNFCIGK